jgi:hypothetical protein
MATISLRMMMRTLMAGAIDTHTPYQPVLIESADGDPFGSPRVKVIEGSSMKVHATLLLIASLPAFTPRDGGSPAASDPPKPAPTLKALAGSYYHGDGLGVNCQLTVKADGTFTFVWRGCLGVYDENDGTAKLIDGHLKLAPTKPNKRDGFRGMETDFIPVSWGKLKPRMYLVPAGEAKEFCNSVNQGREPRGRPHGSHYLRDDDWKTKVDGTPSVPKEWLQWLLAKPIEGKVVEVKPGKVATVDVGSKDGIWAGMELYVEGANFGFVVVKTVEADSCVIGNKFDDLDAGLKPGLKVKSKIFTGDD